MKDRFPNQRRLYVLLKKKVPDEDRIHGVELAITTKLLKQLSDFPTAINERLIKLRFPLNLSRHVTVVSACVLTLTGSDDVKESFYEELNALVKVALPGDRLLLGDLSTRVGSDCGNWKRVLGPHCSGKMNSNGLMLLSLCMKNNLTITNTLLR